MASLLGSKSFSFLVIFSQSPISPDETCLKKENRRIVFLDRNHPLSGGFTGFSGVSGC